MWIKNRLPETQRLKMLGFAGQVMVILNWSDSGVCTRLNPTYEAGCG